MSLIVYFSSLRVKGIWENNSDVGIFGIDT